MIHLLLYSYVVATLVSILFLIWMATRGPWKAQERNARIAQKNYPQLLKEGNELEVLLLLLRHGDVDIEDLHLEDYDFPKTLSLNNDKTPPDLFQIVAASLLWPVILSGAVVTAINNHLDLPNKLDYLRKTFSR